MGNIFSSPGWISQENPASFDLETHSYLWFFLLGETSLLNEPQPKGNELLVDISSNLKISKLRLYSMSSMQRLSHFDFSSWQEVLSFSLGSIWSWLNFLWLDIINQCCMWVVDFKEAWVKESGFQRNHAHVLASQWEFSPSPWGLFEHQKSCKNETSVYLTTRFWCKVTHDLINHWIQPFTFILPKNLKQIHITPPYKQWLEQKKVLPKPSPKKSAQI